RSVTVSAGDFANLSQPDVDDDDTNVVSSSSSEFDTAADVGASFTALKTPGQPGAVERHTPGGTEAGAASHWPLEAEVTSSCSPLTGGDDCPEKTSSEPVSLKTKSENAKVDLQRRKAITNRHKLTSSLRMKSSSSFQEKISLDENGVAESKIGETIERFSQAQSVEHCKLRRKRSSCLKHVPREGGRSRSSRKKSVRVTELDMQDPRVANIRACPKGTLVFPDPVEGNKSTTTRSGLSSCKNELRVRAEATRKQNALFCEAKTDKNLVYGFRRKVSSHVRNSSDNKGQSENPSPRRKRSDECVGDSSLAGTYTQQLEFHSSPEAPGIFVHPSDRRPCLAGAGESSLSGLTQRKHLSTKRGRQAQVKTSPEARTSGMRQALVVSCSPSDSGESQSQVSQYQWSCFPSLPGESLGFECPTSPSSAQRAGPTTSAPEDFKSQGFEPRSQSCEVEEEMDQELNIRGDKSSSSAVGPSRTSDRTALQWTGGGISSVMHFIHYGNN
ncbi:hypothetical protein EGW08_005221, partial [Elysia chlorotica]